MHGNNLDIMKSFPDGYFKLSYMDPPFNTRKTQKRGQVQYEDTFEDYKDFIMSRITEVYRLLSDDGSLFIHLDWHEVHYVKVWTDAVFGRHCFMNDIIWCYDYGARSKSKWSTKHDNILWYVKNPKKYIFNFDQMDRLPYMAPELVGPEKAARGKTPCDWWFHTIVPTMGKEKTGYPTQKPLGILRRIVKVHSNIDDNLLDPFAGSGSFGAAAKELGRNCCLIDSSQDAIKVMTKRLVETS
jgi:site-specific DNA-methyltransferase (adenine-specific)